MFSANFTVANEKFCLSLHYNGDNSYLLVNGKEIINFKAKESEIVKTPNMSLTGLRTYVYDFSVDYRALAADKILDIHKYLMEKNNIR